MLKVFALLCSVSGAALVAKNSKKSRLQGFIIWIASNIIWIIDSIAMANYTQTLLWVFYLITCINGIRNNVDKK